MIFWTSSFFKIRWGALVALITMSAFSISCWKES